MGLDQSPWDWRMALAKFLACTVPQFLQSGKETKLPSLLRENWAIGGVSRGQCQIKGKRREADGAKIASDQAKRGRGSPGGTGARCARVGDRN